MIIRGTTPYHSFILPYSVDQIKELWITYLQNEEIILHKDLTSEGVSLKELSNTYDNAHMEDYDEEDIELSCELTVHLSQEDTLSFYFYPAAKKNIAVIQVRILTTDDEAYASDPINERIFGVLKEGVIGDGQEISDSVSG